MAPACDLPCDADGVCMVCKAMPMEAEVLLCWTCATPQHAPCLASVADYECPYYSPSAATSIPAPIAALSGTSDDLIASIWAIGADTSLIEQEKVRWRRALVSGGVVQAIDKEEKGTPSPSPSPPAPMPAPTPGWSRASMWTNCTTRSSPFSRTSSSLATTNPISSSAAGRIYILSIDGGGSASDGLLARLRTFLRNLSGDLASRITDFLDLAARSGTIEVLVTMLFVWASNGHPLFSANKAHCLLSENCP
ncbi:hypothetical protein COCNU_scaffold014270G000020 [Cocos nucifera]|nr:hypothetical protein [Cocos nucifera]